MNDLLILPFDHRGSMLARIFGVKDRQPTEEEKASFSDLKEMVFEGFLKSLEAGVPKGISGVLVDEQFGSGILRKAKEMGVITAMSMEKSGQDEFDFEYTDWRKHVESFEPTYCKVLVRYNTRGNLESNQRQLQRLKEISDFLRETKRFLLFELLVPPTPDQLKACDNSKEVFDQKLRPKLMLEAIRQLQQGGVEPRVWKLEGVDKEDDAKALVSQVRSGGRDAGVITLGRGESKEKVMEWLRVGAKIQGVVGFAVGRTIFLDAMLNYKTGKMSREEACSLVAGNYKEFVDLWFSVRGTRK
jgi:5-dehydro-2-deoxygluconokinase